MRRSSSIILVSVVSLWARAASAELPATRVAHARTEAVLADLVDHLRQDERARTIGVYVAFDASRSDTLAQAACDDDGDHAIVVSEAMLDLVERVALAQAADSSNHGDVLASYDVSLATQPAGTALLPLPAGAYATPLDLAAFDRAWTEEMRYLLGAELSHGTSGRLVCPRPTLTRERGDDVWTDAERTAADRAAHALYTFSNVQRADERALEWMFAVDAHEDGALALLGAQDALSSRTSSYARLHDHPSARAMALSAWASDWRALGISGPARSL